MRSRHTLFAGSAYLVLAIIITYPVAFQLATHIAGLPGNDSLEFVWSAWWFKHALLDLRANPINISALNYPAGLSFPLLPAMSQSFVLSLPLVALVSPVFAFNFTYLISFPLCALAGYWLCFDLTGDRRAAFLGGLVWGFFPSKSGHALAGHLFQLVVFTLPVAALFLLRALRQPSLRHALAAGVALALAATVHPVNVAYFLIPLIVVVVGVSSWDNRRTITVRSPLVRSLLMTAVVGGALALPLFLPTLLQGDRLAFLVERGVVGFSLDLLAFLTPAPGHPFIGNTALGELARRVSFAEFETIGYLGLVPIALSGLALAWRWRESRVWLSLALVTAILSLGPLLQVNRDIVRLSVEGDGFPILLPYAYLGQLPIFQWSRTPGRLNETTIFAIMIMASLGMATLLTRIKRRSAATVIWAIACLIIPIEYLVRWPMPTAPIPTSPALTALAYDDSFKAVMNYPVSNNTINLIGLVQQTIHQHPLIGGRVYRDQPGTLILHDFLSRTIAAPLSAEDIAPLPTAEQRLAAIQYYGVGRILYQPLGDPDGSARASLDSLLGPPTASDEVVSVYRVPAPALESPVPFFVFGANWHAPQMWQTSTRWFNGIATLYLFSPTERTGALAFTAIPGQGLRRLLIKANNNEVARFGVGDWAEYTIPEIRVKAGMNQIEFYDEDGSWPFVGDPRCQGGSAVAGPFPFEVPCDLADRDSHEYSLAIQDLRFLPNPEPSTPQAIFGNLLELLDASIPTQVHPGDSLTVHLTWRVADVPQQEYTLFIHLLDSNGQLIVGNDSAPAHGSFPTPRWQAGQIVNYNVPLALPTDLSPGQYTLDVGWYTWPLLEHLPLPDGATKFTIGAIEISQ